MDKEPQKCHAVSKEKVVVNGDNKTVADIEATAKELETVLKLRADNWHEWYGNPTLCECYSALLEQLHKDVIFDKNDTLK